MQQHAREAVVKYLSLITVSGSNGRLNGQHRYLLVEKYSWSTENSRCIVIAFRFSFSFV